MLDKKKEKFLKDYMNDIVYNINCKYCRWSWGGTRKTRIYLHCHLHNDRLTEPEICDECKDKETRRKG